MRYRMIGIDLDGTLLNGHGCVSAANSDAIARAQDAGALVVPCTGRAWYESRGALADLQGLELGVFVTGAAICDIAAGETLDLAVMEPHLALRMVEHLCELPEAVLVFRDRSQAGHDYMITGRGDLTHNTRWWFERSGASVHHQPHVTLDDLHHTLRVGVVASASRVEQVLPVMVRELSQDAIIHSFEAIQMPEGEESVHILEAFARGVDKWRGLAWIADQRGIDHSQIAVIGDEINDMSMIQAAGCGIAMGNARQAVKNVADHVTLPSDQAGVAHALGKMLEGIW